MMFPRTGRMPESPESPASPDQMKENRLGLIVPVVGHGDLRTAVLAANFLEGLVPRPAARLLPGALPFPG